MVGVHLQKSLLENLRVGNLLCCSINAKHPKQLVLIVFFHIAFFSQKSGTPDLYKKTEDSIPVGLQPRTFKIISSSLQVLGPLPLTVPTYFFPCFANTSSFRTFVESCSGRQAFFFFLFIRYSALFLHFCFLFYPVLCNLPLFWKISSSVLVFRFFLSLSSA